MGLITDVNNLNDPDQNKFNNQPVPSIKITVPPSQPQRSPLPTLEPALIPTDIMLEVDKQSQIDEQQLADQQPTETNSTPDIVSSVPESPVLDPSALVNSPVAEQTPQPVTNYQSPSLIPYISDEDEQLRRGGIERRLMDESRLTGTHLPTVYQPRGLPNQPQQPSNFNDYAAQLERANAEREKLYTPAPALRPSDNLDYDSLNPQSIMPGSIDQWASRLTNELNRDSSSGKPGTYINPNGGFLEKLTYGIGLLTSAPTGAFLDLQNSFQRGLNQLVTGDPSNSGNQQTKGFIPNLFNPDNSYNGSYLLDSLRGRQYSFTSQVSKDEPIGFRTDTTKAVGQFLGQLASNISLRGTDKYGLPREVGVGYAGDWVFDPGFWAGFAADAVNDITEPVIKLGAAGLRKFGVLKTLPEANSVARNTKTPARVLVTPEPKLVPDPWLTPEAAVEFAPKYEALPQPPKKLAPTASVSQPPSRVLVTPEPLPDALPDKFTELTNKKNALIQEFSNSSAAMTPEFRQTLVNINRELKGVQGTPIPELTIPKPGAWNEFEIRPPVSEVRPSLPVKESVEPYQEFTLKEPIPVTPGEFEVKPSVAVEPDPLEFTNNYNVPTQSSIVPLGESPRRVNGLEYRKPVPLGSSIVPYVEEVNLRDLVRESVNRVNETPIFKAEPPALPTTKLKYKATQFDNINKALGSIKASRGDTPIVVYETLDIPGVSGLTTEPTSISLVNVDGRAFTRTVKPNSQAILTSQALTTSVELPVVNIEKSNVIPPGSFADDLNNDALRLSGVSVVPTSEVVKAASSQLERARTELRRLKASGLDEARIKRQRELVVKLTNEAVSYYDDAVVATPSISSEVFTGSASTTEIANVVSNSVPGSTVNFTQKVDRSLSEVEALMKRTPHPKTGEPLLSSDRFNVFRSWGETRSPKAYLRKIGITDPAIYRMFERNGAFVNESALNSEQFLVKVEPNKPGSFSKSVVVNNPPPVTVSYVEPSYVEPELTSRQSLINEQAKLEKQLDVTESDTEAYKLVEQIADIEARLNSPDLTNPAVLREVQNELVPQDMRGKSPEAVRLTEEKLVAESELESVGADVQRLEAEVKKQKELISLKIKQLENTPDVTRRRINLIGNNKYSVTNPVGDLTTSKQIIDNETKKVVEEVRRVGAVNRDSVELINQRVAEVVAKAEARKLIVEAEEVRLFREASGDSVKNAGVNLTEQINRLNVEAEQAVQSLKARAKTNNETPETLTKKVQDIREALELEKARLKDEVSLLVNRPINNTPIYHGTRVDQWEPLLGGVGEYGDATYFSLRSDDAANHALKPTVYPTVNNEPKVYEYLPSFKKPLDASEAIKPDVLLSFVTALEQKVNSKKDFGYFIKSISLAPNKLKPEFNTLSSLYSKLEKWALKRSYTIEEIDDIKNAVNKELRKSGYDAIINGTHIAVIEPKSIDLIQSYWLDEVDATQSAIAQYNSSSVTASNNTNKPLSNIQHGESSLKAQVQLHEQTLNKLKEVKAEQIRAIYNLNKADEALATISMSEQKASKLQAIADGQKAGEVYDTKLNKPSNDPCKF